MSRHAGVLHGVLLFGEKVCFACGAAGPTVRCSRCLIPVYCGKTCQRQHWRAHKAECDVLSVGSMDDAKSRIRIRTNQLAHEAFSRNSAERELSFKSLFNTQGRAVAVAQLARWAADDHSPAAAVRNRANSLAFSLKAVLEEEGESELAADLALSGLDSDGNAAVAAAALEVLAGRGMGRAQVALAHCALEGRGVARDRARGLALLESAALLPDSIGATARCDLAVRLMDPSRCEDERAAHGGALEDTPPAELARAFRFLESSARDTAGGGGLALFFLARAHLLGIGTTVDERAGAAAMAEAAALGFDVALYDAGLCYARGIGVDQDSAAAEALFQRAHDAGFTEAVDRELGDFVNITHW